MTKTVIMTLNNICENYIAAMCDGIFSQPYENDLHYKSDGGNLTLGGAARCRKMRLLQQSEILTTSER